MNKLLGILKNLNYEVISGTLSDIEINHLCYDARKVESGDLFVCLKGARFDTHTIIDEIIEKGARVLIVDKNVIGTIDAIGVHTSPLILSVDNTRAALSTLSANYFDNPAAKLKIVGITGTKGKTTTAFMIRNILMKAGHKVGMIGTIGIFYGDKHILTENTTPESFVLHEYFKKMLDEGIEYVVMELSSQSLKYYRVQDIEFYFGIWTNIMPEHIGPNEHTDFDDYLHSKLKLFSQSKNALVNSATDYYDDVVNEIKKHNVRLYEKKENKKFNLRIPGAHNQENASLAYEFGKAVGIDENVIISAIENTVVPGRIEEVYSDEIYKVIVDFSHEGNGAKKLFETVREIPHKRIVAIFGCGGNRSRDRRFGMGEVAGQYADFVILTADNSRYEKTIDIIHDIESTLKKYKKENDLENGYIIKEDRREAIEYAIKNKKPGDVICVLGKGHEPFMEMNGEVVPFLDRDVILDVIKSLG